MKSILKISLALVLCASFMLALVSCGEPEGRYTDEYGTCTYDFSGNTVTLEYGEGESVSYIFEIEKEDGKKLLKLYDTESAEEVSDPISYEEGEDFIILDGVKYIKEK